MDLDNRINGNWAVLVNNCHILTKQIINNQGENYSPTGQPIIGLSFSICGNKFLYHSCSAYDEVEIIDGNTYKGEFFLFNIKLFNFTLKRIMLKEVL